MNDLRSLTLPALEKEFRLLGLEKYRAKQVFAWLHRDGKRVDRFEDMTDLPLRVRTLLAGRYRVGTLRVVRRQLSRLDGTQKLLLEAADGSRVEAVWMEYHHGNTVCISTQVGCRMGCRFCASTLGGLVRDLTPGEMLEEVYTLERVCAPQGQKVGGVVLMGIGEPLDNFENVCAFLEILSCPEGKNLSLRHVSLSTCGLIPQIGRLAEKNYPLTLSISLHAPDDTARSTLMPVNAKYPVAPLLEACRQYFKRTGRRISFEYALVAGKNDAPEQASRLGELLRGTGMPVHVNLIPVNEVRERDCRRGSRQSVRLFQEELTRCGVNATVRRELGSDISAACGQLRREEAAKGGEGSAQGNGTDA